MSKDKDKPSTQWHPLFAELLRPLLQDYYEVQTNVAVGDTPREADLLLLRRTSTEPTPFRGLWRHLTTWNVLEFKGPTVAARVNDLALLVELGLGIHRRLNEERHRRQEFILEPEQASFWYVVKSLGRRFLPEARRRLGHLEEVETGLWRSQVLQHLVFLVSSEARVSEPDSVPLHLLVKRSPEQQRELARLVIGEPHYLEWYGLWLGTLHPEFWKEVSLMSGTRHKGPVFDFSAIIEDVGLEKLLASVKVRDLIDTVGPKKVVKELGVEQILANLSAEERQKLKELLK